MNVILFESATIAVELPISDRRAIHILEVLRRKPGDLFDAGVINGPRGKGTLTQVRRDAISLVFTWGTESAALDPITLIIGLPRPQTARALLRELSSLGVTAMHFVTTEKGDINYRQSSLWQSGEWQRHVLAGVEQAFCTRTPEVTFETTLTDSILSLPAAATNRIALDNYESPRALSSFSFENAAVVIAIGSERGWSTEERTLLRAHRFSLAHLGTRVLRTETAAIASVAIVKAARGWI
jgi:16S rRNA (uracil1498-N3)-methyltransferase